ncbi:MAG: energy-coupling factor transporter transmembrane component T family protein [Candidatus Hermodarchaeota archaeon]
MALEYVPGDSLLHRMDARTKILIFLCLVVLTVVIFDPFIIAVMMIIVLVTYRTSGIPRDKLMAVLKPSSPAFFLFLVVNYLTVPPLPGDFVYFYLIPGPMWGPVTLRTTLVGTSSGLRFLFFIVTTRLITLVTPVSEILVALIKFRFPVEAAVSLGIAFASVPLMVNQFRTVIEAQKSRGAKFEIRNPVRKMQAYVPIIVPSIYLTVLRGIDISRTIESKAFTYNPSKRTFRTELVLKGIDYASGFVAVASLIVLAYVRYMWDWLNYPFTFDFLMAHVAPVIGPYVHIFFYALGAFIVEGIRWLIGVITGG